MNVGRARIDLRSVEAQFSARRVSAGSGRFFEPWHSLGTTGAGTGPALAQGMSHSTRRCARGNSLGNTFGNSLGAAIGTIALLALGCAGQSIGEPPTPVIEPPVDDPSTIDRPAIDERQTTTPHEEVPDLSHYTESDAAEACLQTPEGRRTAATEAGFREMMVGNWLLCATPSVFGTTGDVGLAIYEDFRWAKLARGEAGELHVMGGWEHEGSWESIDTSEMNSPGTYQLNLSIDGSGTVITIPVFAEQPAVVRLDNHGVFVADYAKL